MADPLRRYREKRNLERTPEPAGSAPAPGHGALLFVVHEHAARRHHFDLRLELHGVLKSWAVPRGPSADPAERRLAVQVEDHPLEYADFEGVIPAGSYGAGSTIVWDRGAWVPSGDAEQGLLEGKLVFELRGYKLRGEWTLVRTGGGRQAQPEWLLMKHRGDAFAVEGRVFPPESVLSGRRLSEVAAGQGGAARALLEAERLGAPSKRLSARDLKPMLATQGAGPFDADGYFFELKYDGYRTMALRQDGRPSLLLRGGGEVTSLFPEVARALELMPVDAAIDGELVVLDLAGRPSFQAIQQRGTPGRPADVRRAAVERPAVLFAFDLLALGGRDLRGLPLRERKRLLAELVPRLGPLRYADHVEREGRALFREVEARGLEGVVAKRADAPYRAGRSPAWQKLRVVRTADLAVVGFTAGRGARADLGALLLAAAFGEGLVFAGAVGAGLGGRELAALHRRLALRARPTPPCGGPVPRGPAVTWVEPELVAEVRHREWTAAGLLRQPVLLRIREDKRPWEADRRPAAPSPPVGAPARPAAKFTNPDKVFFPDGTTKGEVAAYYRAIAPYLLPYLKDRPLVVVRYPDGIAGKSFFQKAAPAWRPSWLRTAQVPTGDGRRVEHLVVDDAEGLAWLAGLGVIPIHLFAARAGALDRPDWCSLDLDPGDAPFADVVRIARAALALCERAGLPLHVKTSGQRGLHLLVPLGGQADQAQARGLAELLARLLEAELPGLATTARAVGARGGRVYLDYLQNGAGKTLVAPYAVRPRPSAPVSTPLRFSEVDERLDPARFTLRNALARAERLGADPLAKVLTSRPDLLSALGRLGEHRHVPGGAGAQSPDGR